MAGQALAVLLELSQLVSGGILGSGQGGLLGLSLGLFGSLALSLGALGLGLCLGEVAVLTVAQTGKLGAFLDWGLEKDLFLPFKEQTRRVQEGESFPAAVCG